MAKPGIVAVGMPLVSLVIAAIVGIGGCQKDPVKKEDPGKEKSNSAAKSQAEAPDDPNAVDEQLPEPKVITTPKTKEAPEPKAKEAPKANSPDSKGKKTPPNPKDKDKDTPEPKSKNTPTGKPETAVNKAAKEMILGKWLVVSPKEETYYQFLPDGSFAHTFFSTQLNDNLSIKGRYTLTDAGTIDMRYDSGLPAAAGMVEVTRDTLEIKGLLSTIKCKRASE